MKRLGTVLLFLAVLAGPALAAPPRTCFRPFACAPVVQQAYVAPYVAPTYNNVVPVIVREQPYYLDRFHSLAYDQSRDFVKDAAIIKAFDYFKEKVEKLEAERDGTAPALPAPLPPQSAYQRPSGTAVATMDPQPQKGGGPHQSFGKTSPAALAVLNSRCISCHVAGNVALDLANPDSVSSSKRWAAIGLMGVNRMPKGLPPVPQELEKEGKEKELEAWKAKNGYLSDDELSAVLQGWALAGQTAKGK